MNIYLLKDEDDGTVEFVITSKDTEAPEIQHIIDKVKEEKAGEWQLIDICESMPDDVKIISCDSIYY